VSGGLAARVLAAAAGAGTVEAAIGGLYGSVFRLEGARVFSNAAAEDVGCRARRRLRRRRKAASEMRASPPTPPITPPIIAGVLEERWEEEDGVEVVGKCAPAASAAVLTFVEVGIVVGTDVTAEAEELSLSVD